MNNIHIYRIYFRLPPESGGMEKHILHLSSTQRSFGIRVTNIYNVGNKTEDSIQILGFFNLNRIKINFIREILFQLFIILKILRISKESINILHIHGSLNSLYLINILKKKFNSNYVIYTVHDRIIFKSKRDYINLNKCNLIYCTGLNEVNQLKKILKKINIAYMPSAIDESFFTDQFKYVDEKKYDVIIISNLLPKKNISLVLSIAEDLPNLIFLIVGKGFLIGNISETIRIKGLTNVKIVSDVDTPTGIKSLLNSSKVFLSTSLYEGTPTSAMEALSCGLPIVLTPSNNYDEIIINQMIGFVSKSFDKFEIIDLLFKALLIHNQYLEERIKFSSKFKWFYNAQKINADILSII